jgi:signal transduction histidine kinase
MSSHLFRIAQEAIRNAVRHGAAKQIDVSLRKESHFLTLIVKDNGRGLPSPSERGKGLGLQIMAHRAQMIGATFAVERLSGGGTIVQCRLPLLII